MGARTGWRSFHWFPVPERCCTPQNAAFPHSQHQHPDTHSPPLRSAGRFGGFRTAWPHMSVHAPAPVVSFEPRPGGEIGRRTGLKIPGPGRDVRVQVPSWLILRQNPTKAGNHPSWNPATIQTCSRDEFRPGDSKSLAPSAICAESLCGSQETTNRPPGTTVTTRILLKNYRVRCGKKTGGSEQPTGGVACDMF
ncbi:MAG: hypothetical protein RLZZ436_2973 [Planctomycetota bacterium]